MKRDQKKNDFLRESGGAHQKLIKLRTKKSDKISEKNRKLTDLIMNAGKDDKYLRSKLSDDIKNNNDKLSDLATYRGNNLVPIKRSLEYAKKLRHMKADDKNIRDLKYSLGVGDHKREEKKPGLYKQYQDIKRNEAFDICADYVVGCLEGSIDDFDLDLFTEAASFIIDCLDE